MGSLRVGDEVCIPDGGISSIIAVYPQGEKELYELEFIDGAKTLATAEHIWKAGIVGRRGGWQKYTTLGLIEK